MCRLASQCGPSVTLGSSVLASDVAANCFEKCINRFVLVQKLIFSILFHSTRNGKKAATEKLRRMNDKMQSLFAVFLWKSFFSGCIAQIYCKTCIFREHQIFTI